MSKPLILITNDDGITAPGINYLINIISKIGEVWVVSPDSPQSGKGHSVTVDTPIFAKEDKINKNAFKSFSCSGTPSDCIKLALNQILPKKPDLCISGINHGSNASINCIYSGTVAGAVEASIEGIPSIAFSLCDSSWNANFNKLEDYIIQISKKILEKGMKKNTSLNINFPLLKENEKFKGIKYCRQSKANWLEEFEKRTQPRDGRKYYWMYGYFNNLEKNAIDTDLWALNNNYISIVPIKYDLTDYNYLEELIN